MFDVDISTSLSERTENVLKTGLFEPIVPYIYKLYRLLQWFTRCFQHHRLYILWLRLNMSARNFQKLGYGQVNMLGELHAFIYMYTFKHVFTKVVSTFNR